MGATKRQRTKGGKAVVVKSLVLLLEEGDMTGSLTDAIQEFKGGIKRFVNPFPVLVPVGGEGNFGPALEALGDALGNYVEGELKEMQSRTIRLAEIIDTKFATLAARALDSESKARRKVAKLDRTADDNQAYTYITVLTLISLHNFTTDACGRVWHMR